MCDVFTQRDRVNNTLWKRERDREIMPQTEWYTTISHIHSLHSHLFWFSCHQPPPPLQSDQIMSDLLSIGADTCFVVTINIKQLPVNIQSQYEIYLLCTCPTHTFICICESSHVRFGHCQDIYIDDDKKKSFSVMTVCLRARQTFQILEKCFEYLHKCHFMVKSNGIQLSFFRLLLR